MSRKDVPFDTPPPVGAGYAMSQLSRALLAEETSPDPQTRARATARIARWQQVLAHVLEGTADYGSRTPFAEIPAWATPEVVTGGFATGRLLAGGELSEYERELAASIPGIRTGHERLDLNAWHLGDAGIRMLQARLESGDYRIDVPEEAALPVAVWLLQQQRHEQARTLIETIAPFFGRLRFFPPPARGLPASAAEVHVFDVGTVRARLAAQPVQAQVALQRQAIEVRLPLYDAAVEHFLATYAGDWPCRHYPPGWSGQAESLCERYQAAQREGMQTRGRVAELYALLARCAGDPEALGGREVGRIRRIVGDFVGKYGEPGSPTHRAHRDRQHRQIAAPDHHRVARVLAARLAGYRADAGIADFQPLLEPVTAVEATAFAVPVGAWLPQPVCRRLERCRSGTVAELIEHGLVTSAETMAQLLPAMTAEIRSAGFGDATLRALDAATYRAFNRRRSLLLLDLQSQVAIGELPWVAAIEADRRTDAGAAGTARQALVESATLAISAFPQTIVPNKLLQQFRTLAKVAKVELPFVDEVAADIFMGEFSDKFADAARRAGRSMAGTLYARYYAIDTGALAALPDCREVPMSKPWWRRPQPRKSDALAVLCARRAGVELGGWNAAANGAVIEQQQILTTQNLALLFADLGLGERLRPRLGELALTCFEWICARQQMRIEEHHAGLIMLKNTAYAWRQMLFYLSLLDASAQRRAIDAIQARYLTQPESFKQRFWPVFLGLRRAADGHSLPQQGATAEGARVFRGWTLGRHWLLGPPSAAVVDRG